MTREEIDALWKEALRQSIEDEDHFMRYRFAALVAAAEREACAKVCDHHCADYTREGAEVCAAAIRARGAKT